MQKDMKISKLALEYNDKTPEWRGTGFTKQC